jgi:hypothetical protein
MGVEKLWRHGYGFQHSFTAGEELRNGSVTGFLEMIRWVTSAKVLRQERAFKVNTKKSLIL